MTTTAPFPAAKEAKAEAAFHFVLAVFFLCGHIWHVIRARGQAAGFDFKKGGVVGVAGNPHVPESLRSVEGWNQFSSSFLIGGTGSPSLLTCF